MSKKITLEGLDHFKDKENAMIAGKPESTNTATVAHAVGEYFYWKGVLHIVTAAIAVGGTIQTNTNVKPAVLADDVGALKESLSGKSDLAAMDYGYGKIISIRPSDFERGHIIIATGVNGSPTSAVGKQFVRTSGNLPSTVNYIRANDYSSAISDVKYGFWLYKYKKSDSSYQGVIPSTAGASPITNLLHEWAEFDHNTYNYRLVIFTGAGNSENTILPYYTFYSDKLPFLLQSDVYMYRIQNSPYYKKVNYGNISMLSEYYNGQGSDYTLFGENTTSSEIYTKFDALVTAYSNYITKTDLGASSNSDHLYSYDFKPKYANNSSATKMPKIIIIAGQHGAEKSSVYGLYYLMSDICAKWENDRTLDYLRNHVEIIVIPVVNRYGFDNSAYKNANGVNLNRNYDTPEFTAGDDPTSSDYGGAAAFDQPETQIVRDLVEAHPDCLFFIDWHTNGFYKVSTYQDVNWLSLTHFDSDIYLSKIIDAGAFHLTNITAHLEQDYSLQDVGTALCGYMTISATERPTAARWARYACNIIGMTFETNNGFPEENVSWSADEQKANSEIMGNWLSTLFSVYGNII